MTHPTHRRDIARAAAAGIGLLALLVGVPLLLAAAVGWPLPHHPPTWGWLRHALSAPLSDRDLLDILATVTWLAWAYLLLSVIGETITQLRGTTPSRLLRAPGAGPLVHQMVAAILFVLPTMPAAHAAVTPATVAASVSLPPLPPLLSTAVAYPADAPAAVAGTTHNLAAVNTSADIAAIKTARQAKLKRYIVEAPDGGHYDSLWAIAERHLGDGARYTEIFDLNVGRPQPDGDTLTRPQLIRPGWVLLLPPDAHGPGVHDALTAPAPPPADATHPGAHHPPAPAGPTAPVPHDPPAHRDVPAAPPGPAAPFPGPQHPSPLSVPSAAGEHEHRSPLPVDLALGLTAAGAVALLDRARRVAMRRRRRGHRLAPLPAPLRAAEAQLRADARLAHPVATTLRLACALTRTQPQPLHVTAVRVDPAGTVTVHLADPCPPSIPFTGTDKSWQLTATDLDPGYPVDERADPLPALAPLGTDRDGGQVLVNLEAAGLTLLATDDPTAADDLFTSLVGALLAAPWGDVLVRAYVPAELAFRLGPLEHLIAVTELADATADVARLAHATRRDVTAAGLTRLDDLRYAGGAEIIAVHVFCGWRRDQLPPALLDLAADPATDVLAVATTDPDDPNAGWRITGRTLHVDGLDTPIVVPGGVTAAGPLVQHTLSIPTVPASERDDEATAAPEATTATTVVADRSRDRDITAPPSGETDRHGGHDQLSPTASSRPPSSAAETDDVGQPGPNRDTDPEHSAEPTPAAAASTPPGQVTDELDELHPPLAAVTNPDEPAPHATIGMDDATICINVLGPVEITGVADTRHDQVLELLVYLAVHPHGATTDTIADAVWTKPSTLKNVRNRIGEARARVAGAISDPPRWRLLAPVTTDWDVFRRLARGSTEQQRAALELVRGRPFGEMDHADWLHLDGIRTEVEAAIVDLAMTVGEHALATGDHAGAFTAARAGLRASPYEERLFQIALHAAGLQRSRAKMRALMTELESVMEADVEPADEITTETRQLYRRLLRDLAHDPP